LYDFSALNVTPSPSRSTSPKPLSTSTPTILRHDESPVTSPQPIRPPSQPTGPSDDSPFITPPSPPPVRPTLSPFRGDGSVRERPLCYPDIDKLIARHRCVRAPKPSFRLSRRCPGCASRTMMIYQTQATVTQVRMKKINLGSVSYRKLVLSIY
jgi:hypothetical protein